MATAPKPGSLDEAGGAVRPKSGSFFRLRMGGTTLEMPTAIPFKEKFAVRAATGLPLGQFWGGQFKIDEDSFMILWWLARRHNGERTLSLEALMSTWPEDLSEDDVGFDVIEDDGEPTDDPES